MDPKEIEDLLNKAKELQLHMNALQSEVKSRDVEISRRKSHSQQTNATPWGDQGESADKLYPQSALRAMEGRNTTNREDSSQARFGPPPAYSAADASGGLKLKNFKGGKDVKIFLDRFVNFCSGTGVPELRASNVLLNALDDTTFHVVNKELPVEKKANVQELMRYMKDRFQPSREQGQLRLLFRQCKQSPTQDLKSYYTELLDQFIAEIANNKIRLSLIERNPRSSKRHAT